MNKFQEWLEKSKEFQQDYRNPELLDFTIKNMEAIIKDYKDWDPPKTYKYMLTFTLDPKKHDLTNEEFKNRVELYIVNLIRKPEVTKAYYTREHNNTNPHWHVIVHRSSALKSDYLSYYRKNFGLVDISKSKKLEDTQSIEYLSKESEIVQII